MKLKPIAELFHRGLMRHMTALGMVLPAIPLEIDKTAHGALPEAQRALYVEKDGKFRLDVTGMPEPEDTSGLKSALEKERTAREKAEKAAREHAKKFEGIDPDAYKKFMAQFEDAEEAALIAKGAEGMKELLNRRTEKLRKEHQKQLETLGKEKEGALEVARTFMDRVLDNHVRAAAMKAGVHPSAVDDILLRARTIFTLNDEGEPVQMEGEGDAATVVMGKDGKTPFSPGEWLEGMKENAPHWFPAGNSGGGSGGPRGKGVGNTITRAQFEAKDATARSEFIRSGGKVVD